MEAEENSCTNAGQIHRVPMGTEDPEIPNNMKTVLFLIKKNNLTFVNTQNEKIPTVFIWFSVLSAGESLFKYIITMSRICTQI